MRDRAVFEAAWDVLSIPFRWIRDLLETSWKGAITPTPPYTSYRPDVLICNPPSFVGFHLAQKLGVHLHMTFTMPWTPTCTRAHVQHRTL